MSYVEIPKRYLTSTASGVDIALLRRPRAVAALRRRIFALPPTSAVRQRGLGRLFSIVWVTYERRDFTTVPNLFYAPRAELRTAMEGRMDLPELVVGRSAVAGWIEQWCEPFREYRWRPFEVLDGGEVVVFGVEMTGIGAASGAETRQQFHSAAWFEDGLIARQLVSLRRDEIMAAAGFADPA